MNIIRFKTNAAEDRLSKLINRVELIKDSDELSSILDESQKLYSVKNISYVGFRMGKATLKEPVAFWTYAKSWIDHYRDKDYINVDPVVKETSKSIIPLDWASFSRAERKVSKFFSEAADAGVGTQGISIPVRGRNGDFSIFTLTFEESIETWSQFKSDFMRDFQTLAVFFHQSTLRAYKVDIPEFELTDRESEILYWAACGKTSDETAMILGISKRGVRYHASNILSKLNAVNITHAVGKGIYYNLINPPR